MTYGVRVELSHKKWWGKETWTSCVHVEAENVRAALALVGCQLELTRRMAGAQNLEIETTSAKPVEALLP